MTQEQSSITARQSLSPILTPATKYSLISLSDCIDFTKNHKPKNITVSLEKIYFDIRGLGVYPTHWEIETVALDFNGINPAIFRTLENGSKLFLDLNYDNHVIVLREGNLDPGKPPSLLTPFLTGKGEIGLSVSVWGVINKETGECFVDNVRMKLVHIRNAAGELLDPERDYQIMNQVHSFFSGEGGFKYSLLISDIE